MAEKTKSFSHPYARRTEKGKPAMRKRQNSMATQFDMPSSKEKDMFLDWACLAYPAQNFKRPSSGAMSLVVVGDDAVLKCYPGNTAKTKLESELMKTFTEFGSVGPIKVPVLLDNMSIAGSFAMEKQQGQPVSEIWPNGRIPEEEQERLGYALGCFAYEFDKSIQKKSEALSLVPKGGVEGLDSLSGCVWKAIKKAARALPGNAWEDVLSIANQSQSVLFDAREAHSGQECVFHGDLTLGNVLANKKKDGSYEYSVIDFGEAKKQNPADGIAKMFSDLHFPKIAEIALRTINQMAELDAKPAWGNPEAMRIASKAVSLAHRSRVFDPEVAAHCSKEVIDRVYSDYSKGLVNFSKWKESPVPEADLAPKLSLFANRLNAGKPSAMSRVPAP